MKTRVLLMVLVLAGSTAAWGLEFPEQSSIPTPTFSRIFMLCDWSRSNILDRVNDTLALPSAGTPALRPAIFDECLCERWPAPFQGDYCPFCGRYVPPIMTFVLPPMPEISSP